MKIEDSTGSGRGLRINTENRALTSSVSTSEQLDASKKGDSYQIGSGVVTLTDATESPVLYFKNNETFDVILTGVNVTSKAPACSTCGTFLTKIYLDACGIACGTTTAALNNNFGSSKTLCSTITVGGTCATLTGGTASGSFYIPSETFFTTDIAWVVPKGISVALTVTPGSGNTSFPVTITLEGTLLHEV